MIMKVRTIMKNKISLRATAILLACLILTGVGLPSFRCTVCAE